MSPEHEALGRAAAVLSDHLKADPGAVSGRLWCRISPRSTSSSLVFTDSVGKASHPSVSRPVVAQLQASGLFDGRTIELSFDRSGAWEAIITVGDPREVIVRPLALSSPMIDLPEPTDDQRAELHEVWAAGAGDYETAPPASGKQLAELAAALGRPVPPQLGELLALANGAALSGGDEDLDWDRTMTGGWELMPTTEIAEAHADWSDLAAEGPYGGVAHDLGRPGATVLRLAHPGWIPFASDGGGNHLAVDTAPGPTGRAGQVLEFGRDLHDGAFVHADSILDFLAGRRHERPRNPDRNTRVKPSEPRPLLPGDVPSACQSLALFGLTSVEGVTVARAAGLKSLLVRGAGSVDLAGMTNLPLQELRLLHLDGVDFSPLAGHPALRRLSLDNVGDTRGLAALGELDALESVSFAGPVNVGMVEAVAKNPRLHHVSFDRDLPLGDAIAFADLLRPDAPVEVTRESGRR